MLWAKHTSAGRCFVALALVVAFVVSEGGWVVLWPILSVEAFSDFVPRKALRGAFHSGWRGDSGEKQVVPVSYRRRRPLSPLKQSVAQIADTSCKQEDFFIRRGTFRDLHAVADLMMDSFYEPNSIMFHYHRILELDRLQNNFPYDSSRHEFFVACSPNDDIIGFCDVDGRPSNRRDAPPRPYLSDLAVDTKWRRRGIATGLIVACEEKAKQMGCDHLYLRVEGKNEAALRMYSRMNYSSEPHPIFGVKDTTILLKCCLSTRLGAESSSDSAFIEARGAHNFTMAAPEPVLDYSV